MSKVDARQAMSAGIDDRIGATPTPEVDVFDGTTRNPDFWGDDVDLSSVSITDHRGVLVAPDTVLTAGHWTYEVGQEIQFITRDNETITREVAGVTVLGTVIPDLAVCVLGEDVTECSFARAALTTLYDHLADWYVAGGWYVRNLPVMIYDRDGYGYVQDIESLTKYSGTSNCFYTKVPTDDTRLAFNKPDFSQGDSGSPVYLIGLGRAFLLGLMKEAHGDGGCLGSMILGNEDAINAAMTSLGSSYQLTEGGVGFIGIGTENGSPVLVGLSA